MDFSILSLQEWNSGRRKPPFFCLPESSRTHLVRTNAACTAFRMNLL